VEIELRQHQDGSFILEVRQGATRSEIDVTPIIQEIFRDKLKELQARVRMEEKYRNWVVDSAQQSKSALSTAFARYSTIVERLKQANAVITMAVDSWNQKKDLKQSMTRLMEVAAQNEHFVQNDKTLQLLEEMSRSIKKV
jgi:hypothetical protein